MGVLKGRAGVQGEVGGGGDSSTPKTRDEAAVPLPTRGGIIIKPRSAPVRSREIRVCGAVFITILIRRLRARPVGGFIY